MIVGIITDPGIGGTFLTWTLHYLAGDDEYFYTPNRQWVSLSKNPLTKTNAHNCMINHPSIYSEFVDCTALLTTVPPKSFHTVYFHQLHDLQFSRKPIKNYNIHEDIQTITAINIVQSISKLIVVELPSEQALYMAKFEGRSFGNKINDPSQCYASFEEQYDDFFNTYFYNDKLKFNDIDNKWTYREFMSLNIRPFMTNSVIPGIDLSKENYYINCFELFNNLDTSIKDIFSFLGLTIADHRYEPWLTVYKEWQLIHYDRMLFCNYFDKIIHSIIHNQYMDLTRFNLDIVREAVIQHVLIYKYGLTLKSWGLEKFPNNTQDLHVLLEPNIYHQVEDIYNVLK